MILVGAGHLLRDTAGLVLVERRTAHVGVRFAYR